jgi:membrane-associated phospholipid phosphatase
VFAHLAGPHLGVQFQPLHAELTRLLANDDMVLMSQRYLEAGAGIKVAVKGGGVSAMPSMHMATATILILAAWRTKRLPLALLFWAMTFFGSIYLGYHYAVDAPVAAAVAVICWFLARRVFGEVRQ